MFDASGNCMSGPSPNEVDRGFAPERPDLDGGSANHVRGSAMKQLSSFQDLDVAQGAALPSMTANKCLFHVVSKGKAKPRGEVLEQIY